MKGLESTRDEKAKRTQRSGETAENSQPCDPGRGRLLLLGERSM